MMKSSDNFRERLLWKREYTIVLVLNVLYILFFAYLMLSYT